MSGIDTQIQPLVEFLNQLDGVVTIGSCQGHDDGGELGDGFIHILNLNVQIIGLLDF